jgi:ribonuclease Z
LLLRLSNDGHGALHIAGPGGVGTHIDALRNFVKFRHPTITALQLVPPTPASGDDGGDAHAAAPAYAADDKCDAAAESYQDDSVLVWPLFAGEAKCQLCELEQSTAREAERRRRRRRNGRTTKGKRKAAQAVTDDDEEDEEEEDSDESSSVNDDEDEDDDDDAEEEEEEEEDDDDDDVKATEADGSTPPPPPPRPTTMTKDPAVLGYACSVRDGAGGEPGATFVVLDCHDDASSAAAAAHPAVACCVARRRHACQAGA